MCKCPLSSQAPTGKVESSVHGIDYIIHSVAEEFLTYIHCSRAISSRGTERTYRVAPKIE